MAIPWESVEWPVLFKGRAAAGGMFDWTINLGQVGIAITFVFSLGVWATAQKYALIQVKEQLKTDALATAKIAEENRASLQAANADYRARLEELKVVTVARLDKFETRLDDYNKLLIAMARQEERLGSVEDKVAEIQRHISNLVNDMGNFRLLHTAPSRIVDAMKTIGSGD